MRRGFWFVAGAGAGIYMLSKAQRAAETFTPEGLHDRLASLSLGAQLFGEEVRVGMVEKETELRARLVPTLDDTPALSASAAHTPDHTPAHAKELT